jgi:hypothetical protein
VSNIRGEEILKPLQRNRDTAGRSIASAAPAPFIGLVDAPDEESAIAKAIDQFKIEGEQQAARLMPRDDCRR